MALSVKVGAFNTGTGTSNIVVTGVGFLPKALLFWWTGRTGTTDAAGRASHFAGYGACTSTTQRWAIVTNDIDAAAAQDAATAKAIVNCLLSVSAAGAIDGRADLASFDSDGFTLSVADAFPRDQRVHYLALGGTDLTNAKAGEFTGTAAAIPHNESSTDPGFQPDVLIFANRHDSGTTGEVALATAGVVGFGAAKSSSAQGAIALAADEASTSMDTDGYGYTGECNAAPSVNAGGSVPARAAFVSMDANGFTVNRLEGTSLWARFYLALKGCQVFVGNNVTSVTGAATIVTSGFGFAPKAVLVFSACRATSTQDAATAPWHTSMGAATSTTERGAQGSISRDAVADAVVGTAIEHDEVYVSLTDATPPAIDGLMDISSFDSDGITYIMDDGDGAARRFFYVAFGDAASAFAEADGSASGAATVASVAAAVWNGVTAAAGVAASTVAGVALWLGVASASGAATAAAPAATVLEATASASGLSTPEALSAALWATLAASDGVATATAEGADGASGGAGAATGTGTASGVGAATVVGQASSTGTATPLAVSASILPASSSAAGIAAASGAGGAVLASDASSSGVGAVAAVAAIVAPAIASDAGVGTAAGVGQDANSVKSADANAAGTSLAIARSPTSPPPAAVYVVFGGLVKRTIVRH